MFFKSRKFWYTVATFLLTCAKAAWPDAPLPDPSLIAGLGLGLVGSHAMTDAMSQKPKVIVASTK